MASWAELKQMDVAARCLTEAKQATIEGQYAAAYALLSATIGAAQSLQAELARHFQAEARASGIARAPDRLEPPLWVNR